MEGGECCVCVYEGWRGWGVGVYGEGEGRGGRGAGVIPRGNFYTTISPETINIFFAQKIVTGIILITSSGI